MTTAQTLDAALGEHVTFTRHLHRRTLTHPDPGRRDPWRNGTYKAWTPEAYPGAPEPAPREGIIVGVRTLANGERHYDREDGTSFRATEYVRAYLVAFDLRRTPVLVLPEHVTREVDA